MKLFIAVPMTPSVAVSDVDGRRYRQFVPFNFPLSLAVSQLHGILVLVTGNKFIAIVVVTSDNCSPVLLTPVINLLPVSTTLAITENPGQGLIAGVIDTAEQLMAGVVDTGDKRSYLNISANFAKKFKMAPMEYLGAWGALIHEKNVKSKISCQAPFKLIWEDRNQSSAVP
jgi:hypothetical protein